MSNQNKVNTFNNSYVYSPNVDHRLTYNTSRRYIEPNNIPITFSSKLPTRVENIDEKKSHETDTLKPKRKDTPKNKQDTPHQQNTPKSNRRRARNQRNTDEDQYVALGTKIIRLIIKIVSSCKTKKRVI
jgi:hypothetical protein